MSKKPLILYVDDEPHNLTVFETSLPEEWEILTFDNPMKAISALEKLNPALVVSDQRMPGTSGVEFLEIVKRLKPLAVRVIVTGYSDENLVIESVRKAQVFDYIRKPWDSDDLEAAVKRALDFYQISIERKEAIEALQNQKDELEEKNNRLEALAGELSNAQDQERALRLEIESWIPPFLRWALEQDEIRFPIRKDIVGITFDIIQSSKMHGIQIQEKSLRSLVIQSFSEAIIKNGGWRESHSGDSAYGHFGLVDDGSNPFDAAYAVSREFRVALKNLSERYKVEVECGISIHVAKDCLLEVHEVQVQTPNGVTTQKSFDTTSNDIDFLHRIEKLVHRLPGTNVILTGEVFEGLSNKPKEVVTLGNIQLPGTNSPTQLYMLPSMYLQEGELEIFREELGNSSQSTPENVVSIKKSA